MKEMLELSVYFGVAVSLLAYGIGYFINKKTGITLLNPLLIAVALVILVLKATGVDYEDYNDSAKLLGNLLTPATVALAIPLYEQLSLLKKNYAAILLGVLSGVLTSLTCVFVMSLMFSFDHAEYVTLLPKSITTAMGIGVSEELGGYVTLTVVVILITGILGNMFAVTGCKLFGITEPVAKGVAIGSCSHAMGTSKAMEIGEVEGAISGLTIAVSGLMTVALASLYSGFIK